MEAKHAREIADAINAPNPEDTLKKIFDVVSKAAKRGKYVAWIVLRAIDVDAVKTQVENLGYTLEIQASSDESERLLGINW